MAWNKWWHITARKLLLAYQKRYWGLVGNYLKQVTGVVNPHLAPSQADFSLDSGVGQISTDPPQVMSPNMEGPSTKADAQPSNGSISQIASQVTQPSSGSTSQSAPQVQDEPKSQAKSDPTMETKPESGRSTHEVN